jgi:MoxR-like ATPase
MRILKRFINTGLILSLFILQSVVAPTGSALASSSCESLLSKDERLLSARKLSEDKAIALFQKLPKKFRKEIAHDLAVFLAKYSPEADAPKRAATLFFSEEGLAPKTFDLALDYVSRGEYISKTKRDYLEFAIRMHPDLNEIHRLFNLPGFDSGQKNFDRDINSTKAQLMHLDPIQAQIVVRSTIHEMIEKKDSLINPYSFSILIKAAEDLATDKASRFLAQGLKNIFDTKSLLPKLNAEEKQLRLIIRRTLDNTKSGIAFARIKSAIFKTLPSDADSGWGIFSIVSGILTGVGNAGNLIVRDNYEKAAGNAWINSNDFGYSNSAYTQFDHWSWQIYTLGAYVATYSIKALYHFFYDLREPHPGNYLKEETDLELKFLKDRLRQQTLALYSILGVPQSPKQNTSAKPRSSTQAEQPEVEKQSSLPLVKTDAPKSKYQKTADKTQVRSSFKKHSQSGWKALSQTQEVANKAFFKYFDETRLHLLERDTLLEHIQLSLLLSEPGNIQILGEPGVAKTLIAIKALGNIVDENNNPSLFRIQMGKNTTIGDLLGIVKQSGLKEDRIVRAAERAIPGYRFAFLDEYYDAPIDARRDLLSLQAEGVISVGGETYRSKGKLTLYASNKYPNQVFFEAGNDDPRAEMDRMGFTHIISPTFEYDEHMIDLETVARQQFHSKLNFEQIDQLQTLVNQISIPRYFLAKTKMIVNQLRRVELKREHDSKVEWLKRERNGEVNLTPPDYMTRVLSPRSEKRAYQLLKAFALMDWLGAKARGLPVSDEPRIHEGHFAKLVEFFTFNGPSDEHIDRILREYPEGSVPFQQFFQLKKRRAEFNQLNTITDRNVDQQNIMKEFSEFLNDLSIQITDTVDTLTPSQNKYFQKLNDTNVPVAFALVQWHNHLGQKISAADKIQEISITDVANLKAYHLSTLLIEELLEND